MNEPSTVLNRLIGAERLLAGARDLLEADLIGRVTRLESDTRDVKASLGRIEPILARIDAQMSHLATKAELAAKPSHAYLWGVLAALIAAYGSGLAALAILK